MVLDIFMEVSHRILPYGVFHDDYGCILKSVTPNDTFYDGSRRLLASLTAMLPNSNFSRWF